MIGDLFVPSRSDGVYFGVVDVSNDGVIDGFETGSFIGAILIIDLALSELIVYVTDMDLTDWGGMELLPVTSVVWFAAFYVSFFGDVNETLSFFYLIVPVTAASGLSAFISSFGLCTIFTGLMFT